MENLKQTPVVGNLITLFDTYPRISAWVVLSVGMIALLIYEGRDVGLTAANWIALIIASIAVAGLCIWIVSWEDDDETTDSVVVKSQAEEKPAEEKSESAE